MAGIFDSNRVSLIREAINWEQESQQYRDDLFTADKRRGQAFQRWADDLIQRGFYESAYAAYSKAIDAHLTMGVACDFVKCLDVRATIAMKLGAYKFALRDGMELVYTDPRNPIGYIRAGKAYEEEHEYRRAMDAYSEGIKNADLKYPLTKNLDVLLKAAKFWNMNYMATPQNQESSEFSRPLSMTSYVTSILQRLVHTPLGGSRPGEQSIGNQPADADHDSTGGLQDPLQHFPPEILSRILDEIPVLKWMQLRQVSRSWNSMILQLVRSAQVLEIAEHKWPISAENFAALVKMSKGYVTAIILENVMYRDADSCAQLLLYGYSAQHKVLTLERRDVQNLRSLTLRFCTCMFKLWMLVPNKDWMVAAQLRELCVRMENAPEVIYLLAEGRLPRLEVLECFGRYDIVDCVEDVVLLNDNRVYEQHRNMKVLRLGRSLPARSEFPYVQPSTDYSVSQRSLERVVSLLPELEELTCVKINTNKSSLLISGIQQRRPRLNLMELTPKLKKVDFSWSSILPAPLLPSTCQELSLNFLPTLSGLRSCRTEDGVRLYMDVFFEEVEVDASADVVEDQNEYRNLKTVNHAHSRLPASVIIDALARCDSQNLTRLNLHGCTKIDFASRPPSHSSDFLRHTESYGYSFAEAPFNIAQLIPAMFPNMRVLLVGYNSTVTDSTLRALRPLRKLRYLDVSVTKVTDSGLEDLVVCTVKFDDHQLGSMSDVPLLTAEHPDAVLTPSAVKKIIVTGCSNVVGTTVPWNAVGCDVVKMNYSTNFEDRYDDYMDHQMALSSYARIRF
ncbi:hypothetical protein V1512DRAFT_246695 [Lipomyces arxii]|uniref:uncharacterized protein n=1 Tax=Lipomyces arxii TaxID=56418 RepID=UPI0034CD8B9A